MAIILTMANSEDTAAAVVGLTRIPASDLKHRGWRGVVEKLDTERALLVTNHDRPDAVIVSTAEYARLTAHAAEAEARTEDALARLREQFDQRLATLRSPRAGHRLRAVMRTPARLGGKLKAGSSD